MRSLLLGAAFAALTSPAFAVTFISGAGGPGTGVFADTPVFLSETVDSTDSITEYSFSFTAMEDLLIVDFGVGASGSNEDLLDISFNLDFLLPPSKTWTSFNEFGTSATGEFDDFILLEGESFELTFYTEADTNANITAFFTTEVAPIPVPAALPLMVGALGTLGFAGYRRKAS